jgi:hypothetical protein
MVAVISVMTLPDSFAPETIAWEPITLDGEVDFRVRRKGGVSDPNSGKRARLTPSVNDRCSKKCYSQKTAGPRSSIG